MSFFFFGQMKFVWTRGFLLITCPWTSFKFCHFHTDQLSDKTRNLRTFHNTYQYLCLLYHLSGLAYNKDIHTLSNLRCPSTGFYHPQYNIHACLTPSRHDGTTEVTNQFPFLWGTLDCALFLKSLKTKKKKNNNKKIYHIRYHDITGISPSLIVS